jgi:RimJ/RimL family protein N-acetyltransferase
MSVVVLRPVETTDLDAIFEQMRDPESVNMAAFTAEDPSDRNRFDAHMEMVMSSPENTLRAVTSDDLFVGTIGSFVSDGATEVTYWLDRAYWGQGVASRALALFLHEVQIRPLMARAASDNAGSLRVLHKAGFQKLRTEVAFAPGRGTEIEETILQLP